MEDYNNWRGKTVYDKDGDKIGTLSEIYIDETSGKPAWGTVQTGFFGNKENFFPLALASQQDDSLVVNTTAEQVKNAPKTDADEFLSGDEERELYGYYGQDWGTDETSEAGSEGAVGHDTSGPTTDNAMTRSEEELEVGTRRQEVGRVRLKKYIVTENVTTTVPVQREEVRVEREEITDANRDDAMSGSELSDEEHEVALSEEVPVVSKKVVPKERVKLTKDTLQDEQEVSSEVRKEQIDVDGDGDIEKRQ